VQYLQPLVGGLFGLWGLYLIIHFFGHLGVTDLASIFIGIGLVLVGALSVFSFLRKQAREKSKEF
jgi:positive regulator of sigma E activity